MFDERDNRIRKIVLTKGGQPKGRKRDMDAVGSLGLVMYWYRTRGSLARQGALAFGLTATPMYKWLRFSRRVLLFVLHRHPLAMVKLPTWSEMAEFMLAIGSKYATLLGERVWGACDGLKVLLEKSTDWQIQNRYYN